MLLPLLVVLVVVAAVAIVILVRRYVDVPFGTPKSARLRYEATIRAADEPTDQH